MHYIARIIQQFRTRQEGAVTVDWVLLTALVVGMAGLGVASIGGAAGTIGEWIVEDLTADENAPEE